MNTKEIINSLIPGKKYTLVGMTEFGYPYCRHIKMTEVREKEYKHYQYAPVEKSIELVFVCKGKQLAQRTTIRKNTPLLIWDGWHDVKTEMFIYDLGDGLRQSLPCFDHEYFDIATNSVDIKPIIVQR